MLRSTFYQQSMAEVDADFIGLPADSFERQLRDLLPRLVSADDFRSLYAEDGAGSCCPIVLTGMLLLQFRFNVPDLEVIRRSRRDLGWRYALGLVGGEAPPAVTSLRRFRAKLRAELGDDFLHRRVIALAIAMGHLDDAARQVVDSTNTDCRGAVIEPFNLVATGIGHVIRTVARCVGQTPLALATGWGLQAYLARSIKGGARIDWSDPKARNQLLTQEIQDANNLPGLVRGMAVTFPTDVDEALDLLARVALQDVEQLPDGTYAIAQGTAAGRVISVTDPEARHGRKSASKTIRGFKTHVLGTIASQFVTGIAITDAGTHDASPTVDLLDQAERLGVKPQEALGDGAYGSGANVRACKAAGVDVRTRLPTPSGKTAIPKRDFTIDVDANTVTCPEGHLSSRFSMVKDPDDANVLVARHHFDRETCQACPLKARCSTATAKGGARTLALSPYEREHQDVIAFNKTPAAAAVLRTRSAIERLISHLVRLGMRHARFFGMHMVQFQAFMTSAAYNLQRLITLAAKVAPLPG